MGNVFISYRRDDAAAHAGRLADRLVARLGAQRVFMDVQDIQPGQDFEQAIEQTLAECNHLLAVVGPRWAQTLQARAANADDFVRREISIALARGITVIPVLVGGAQMPGRDVLPSELARFDRCQAVEVRDNHFDEDAASLVNFLAGGSRAVTVLGWRIPRRALVWSLSVLSAALALVWLSRQSLAPPASIPTELARAAVNRQSTLPSLAFGTWTLRGARDDDGKDWSNSVLQITSQQHSPDGLLLQGRFTWRLDNELIGTETVAGHYIARTRQIILEGSSVSDAQSAGAVRLAVGSYSAVLSDDERSLVKGRWGSTAQTEPGVAGEWQAMR
jgi:hypothetical protein